MDRSESRRGARLSNGTRAWVGDAAFVATAATWLSVAKQPALLLTVGYAAGDPAATPVDISRFKALANELVATHSQ
jgi:hypothetical protein